jgi:DNA-binding NtrC family response regulator
MNANVSPAAVESQPLPAHAHARRILVVEDDAEVSGSIAQMISHLGHTPCACSHVEQALKFLETEQVDLMLVDYRMPDLTGLDLICILKEEGRHIPVIMMTGFAETEERVLAEGRDQFIVLKKPITVPALGKAVEESLKRIGLPA